MTTPPRPPPPPPCPVCRKRGCRGHEPYDRCSTLVAEDGVLVIDLRGEDRPADQRSAPTAEVRRG